MTERRYATILFNDGSRLSIEFDKQAESAASGTLLRKAMESPTITFEADGDLYMIPTSSIKYVQIHPVPESLPPGVIQGATIDLMN